MTYRALIRTIASRSEDVASSFAYFAIGAGIAYWIITPNGNAFNQDSLRDYFQGAAILDGRLPMEGPAAGKLGFSLSLLWPFLVAAILAVNRAPAWIAVFSALWFGLATLLAARLAERILGRGTAAVGAAAFVSSVAITSVVPLFTHSAFILPFTTGGLLALVHALGPNARGSSYTLAVGLLVAATQMHASAFPLLSLLLLRAWDAPDVSWSNAWAAAAALVIPFVPWGLDSFPLNAERIGVLSAVFGWLRQNTALVPVIATGLVLGRPSLLRRRKSLRVLALVVGSWAAWLTTERLVQGDWPVLQLFNVRFQRPPVLDDPAGASVAATLLHGLRQIVQPFGLPHHAFTELLTLGALVWGFVRFVQHAQNRADTRRPGARLILVGLAVTIPPALLSELRAPHYQPQYLQHFALMTYLLIAAGLDAGAAVVARLWHALVQAGPRLAGDSAAVPTKSVRRVTMSMAIVAVLSAALSPAASPALVAVSARTGVTPLLVPLFGWMQRDELQSATAEDLGFARALRAVIDDAGRRFGSYELLRTRVHGASGRIAFAEEGESSWLPEFCFAPPLPPPRQPVPLRSHELLVTRSSPLFNAPRAHRVGRIGLTLWPFETTLDFARTTLAVTRDGAGTTLRRFDLPFSHKSKHSVTDACIRTGQTFAVGDETAPAAWRVTIPRFVNARAGNLTVLLKESPGSRCAVTVKLDGVVLPAQGESDNGIRSLSFALLASSAPTVVDVELPACVVLHLDVFDADGT